MPYFDPRPKEGAEDLFDREEELRKLINAIGRDRRIRLQLFVLICVLLCLSELLSMLMLNEYLFLSTKLRPPHLLKCMRDSAL